MFLNYSWQLQFIQSEFRGQLPKPFSQGPLATQTIPSNMNDQNLEEPSRYVSRDPHRFRAPTSLHPAIILALSPPLHRLLF